MTKKGGQEQNSNQQDTVVEGKACNKKGAIIRKQVRKQEHRNRRKAHGQRGMGEGMQIKPEAENVLYIHNGRDLLRKMHQKELFLCMG